MFLAVFMLFCHEILRFLALSVETECCRCLVFDKGLGDAYVPVLRVLTVVEELRVEVHLAISVNVITACIITVR